MRETRQSGNPGVFGTLIDVRRKALFFQSLKFPLILVHNPKKTCDFAYEY